MVEDFKIKIKGECFYEILMSTHNSTRPEGLYSCNGDFLDMVSFYLIKFGSLDKRVLKDVMKNRSDESGPQMRLTTILLTPDVSAGTSSSAMIVRVASHPPALTHHTTSSHGKTFHRTSATQLHCTTDKTCVCEKGKFL